MPEIFMAKPQYTCVALYAPFFKRLKEDVFDKSKPGVGMSLLLIFLMAWAWFAAMVMYDAGRDRRLRQYEKPKRLVSAYLGCPFLNLSSELEEILNKLKNLERSTNG